MKKNEMGSLLEIVGRCNAFYAAADPDMRFSELTAAAVTGYKISTLRCMRTRGGGPAFVRVGSRVWYRKADLLSYLSKFPSVNSTSEYSQEEK